jgi:hypothetical protein
LIWRVGFDHYEKSSDALARRSSWWTKSTFTSRHGSLLMGFHQRPRVREHCDRSQPLVVHAEGANVVVLRRDLTVLIDSAPDD